MLSQLTATIIHFMKEILDLTMYYFRIDGVSFGFIYILSIISTFIIAYIIHYDNGGAIQDDD